MPRIRQNAQKYAENDFRKALRHSMLDSPDDSQAQAIWDARCAVAPRCDCCGGSVYPHDIFIETTDDVVYCQKCFRIVHTEDIEL